MRFALLLLLALTAGCSSAPPTGMAADVPGSTWTLERIVPADGAIVRGSGEQVSFGPEGSLAVSSCNQCSGRYEMEGDVLTVSQALACTRRACPAGTVELERYFDGTSTLSRDGAYLVVRPDSVDAQVLLLPAEIGQAGRVGQTDASRPMWSRTAPSAASSGRGR